MIGNDAQGVRVGVRVHLLLMDITARWPCLSPCPPNSAPSHRLGQVSSLLGHKFGSCSGQVCRVAALLAAGETCPARLGCRTHEKSSNPARPHSPSPARVRPRGEKHLAVFVPWVLVCALLGAGSRSLNLHLLRAKKKSRHNQLTPRILKSGPKPSLWSSRLPKRRARRVMLEWVWRQQVLLRCW